MILLLKTLAFDSGLNESARTRTGASYRVHVDRYLYTSRMTRFFVPIRQYTHFMRIRSWNSQYTIRRQKKNVCYYFT